MSKSVSLFLESEIVVRKVGRLSELIMSLAGEVKEHSSEWARYLPIYNARIIIFQVTQ